MVGARSLTLVLLAVFGGVLTDRLRRVAFSRGRASAAAVTQLVIAAVVLTSVPSVPLLVLLSVCNGTVAAISLPAIAALTP